MPALFLTMKSKCKIYWYIAHIICIWLNWLHGLIRTVTYMEIDEFLWKSYIIREKAGFFTLLSVKIS